MSQEQVRELLSVELTQDRYSKIYNSPYQGEDISDDTSEDDDNDDFTNPKRAKNVNLLVANAMRALD